ncbi:MAG: ABC transporter substrate-binding protein, partial [Anaerolineaceae bacterium]|nr:ABC transporter substrate-binding protein [Anaerolineaceae bacterium]
MLGGSLVAKEPETGEIVPYLAESWEISEDGLTYTFHLKDGIKFHDGTPFTAHDYAFTLNRAIAPETGSPGTAGMLGTLIGADATDDLTLILRLSAPNAILMENLAFPGFMMPFSKAYVEANDDEYLAHNPMSVGPYTFKEWISGDHIL